MVLCAGAADYLTGVGVHMILLYLVPVGYGTWFGSVRIGLSLGALAATASTVADLLVPMEDLSPAKHVWNGLMELGAALALVILLGAFRNRLEWQETLARTDALTHIPNRRAFIEAASVELERARRHRRPLTVAYFDCDDFKDVNDRLGHAEGDALLVTVAHTLRAATRSVDAVARLGGDEFALILPEADAAMAGAILTRLRSALLAAMDRHAGWEVGFSIGAAVFLQAPVNVDDVMARADELMYAAKREAKGSLRLGVFGGAARAVAGAEHH